MHTKRLMMLLMPAAIILLFAAVDHSNHVQAAQRGQAGGASAQQGPQGPMPAVFNMEDSYLQWRLLPSEQQAYAAIDGKHIKQYVADQTALSRKYRDQGHQFWGRIIGTSADTEDAQWMADKFKGFGLSDVHIQQFDLEPQWMPQSWNITATGSGKTLHLDTAQPAYQTASTTGNGLDLEAVYVGLGSEADFAGKDVHGKAVFLFSMPLPGSWRHTATAEGALKRAEDKGAAAIFCVITMPGNIRTQLYPTGNKVPTFSMGMQDGYAMRDLIGQSAAGQAPRVKVRLDVQMAPNLKTATVWGTLPGMTDEKIYVVAHRDGWFEAGSDNASGVATMLGLAEHFAKIPKEKRRRTIVFLGTSGHHNGGAPSGNWIAEHKDELFPKTALIINCEHTDQEQVYLMGETIRKANTSTALFWYTGGSARLVDMTVKAYEEFGVPIYAEPERSPAGEIGRYYQFAPSLQVMDCNMFFHSDHDGDDNIPPTGLAAVTRAYTKIIEGVNTLDLKDLQRPAGTGAGTGSAGAN